MSKCGGSGYYNSPRISSEYQDCSLLLTFDQYSYCSFKCQYCFAYFMKTLNPAYKEGIEFKPINVERICKIIKGEIPDNPYYANFFKYRFPFHWGGLAEPFDAFEKQNKVGYRLLETLVELNYPTIISSKGGNLMLESPYYDLFKKASKNKNFAFQFSIVTGSDEMSQKVEQGGCPTTSERLKAMKAMSDLGYWTILRLRPYMIGITDVGIDGLFENASKAGCKAISTEFFCLEMKCNKILADKFKIISELSGLDKVGGLLKYYRALSPHERGGYLRLNRDVKERYVKQMYQLCKKYNFQFNTSDPDYKELNQSGSCCGLPETKEQYNSELINYNRAQLTHLLKELRINYWKSKGKDKYLCWEDIEKLITIPWMDEYRYYGDSLKYWITDYKKEKMTFRHEFLQTWNNLRSAHNPQNYFHGKIVADHLDKNKNMVFRYEPHDYEIRWMEEGIL